MLQTLRRPDGPVPWLEASALRRPGDGPRGGGIGIGEVRLLRGPFRCAQERAGRHLLEVPIDLLLDAWQQDGEPSGRRVGHYLSACSLMWAATGEAVFRCRAEHVVRRLVAWLRATGFGALGVLDPLHIGLEDACRHIGSGLAHDLLAMLGFAGDEASYGFAAADGGVQADAPLERIEQAEQRLVNTVLAQPQDCILPFDEPYPPAAPTPALSARIGASIFAADGDVLCVAQYVAAELTWRERGLRVSQVTAFPERNAVRLIFGAPRVAELTLRLRHPSWCRTMAVRLNGQPLIESREAGRWLDLGRRWCHGDVVDLELPMHLHLVPTSPGAQTAMLMYGPMALVAAADGNGDGRGESAPMPRLALRGRALEDAVRRVGPTLNFKATDPCTDGALELMPRYQAAAHRGLHFELA